MISMISRFESVQVVMRSFEYYYVPAAGIGAATVKRLVREGAKVVIADVAVEQGQALEAELAPNAAFITCDVRCDMCHACFATIPLSTSALHGICTSICSTA